MLYYLYAVKVEKNIDNSLKINQTFSILNKLSIKIVELVNTKMPATVSSV